MRLNNSAYDRCLSMDGILTKFYHYTGTIESYDGTTQIPSRTGTIVEEFVDVQEYSIYEISNSGGLITADSKKFIASIDTVLEKGDEVLDSSEKEIYKLINVTIFKNRKFFLGNKIEDGSNQY